ncbi:exodeoxyribonuclease V subunit gamma [Candidatus Enterovibrio altilux]|uniref:exodeoxyribonuclease V subunit gamma n=1 Tax=Candidatus Enterovibrio altilux TaxID=1927128 RepID=UPI000BBB8A21|nr:exodeoxyribonuclease V subunit gamma [Candidatus Enterovibrio luxaltus]
MFTVYHSNKLEVLKNLLVALVQEKPLSNPLQKELILVQSSVMAEWLKFSIAKEQSIFANIEFSLPTTFIWQVFTQLLSDVPHKNFFNKETIMWKLMRILPDQLNDPDFAELKHYLEDDDGKRKSYQLARKIADIYDQYLMYRPEWIKAWENASSVPELTEENLWQPKLWQALYNYTLQQGQSAFHHANLYDKFIDVLISRSRKPTKLTSIERVFVFGISTLPPRCLHTLKALGKHINVHYMLTNACRYYWGDIRDNRYLAHQAVTLKNRISRTSKIEDTTQCSLTLTTKNDDAEVGNSLLASMGKLGRDNLLLISELQCQEVDQGFVDVPRNSLLHHIQADILNLDEPGDVHETTSSKNKHEISLDDHSLMIEVCHSPMREVEVLYDHILEILENNPTLTPKDIVVMVTNINAYSSIIQAVFGNVPEERFVPFYISDCKANNDSPILTTFLRLLNLPESRCSAAELLEVLAVPAVLRKFGFNNYQFKKATFWIKEVGIRWGLNDTTAAHFSLPDQHQNTWLFGLNRMLLGYAMPSQSGLFNNVLAYDEVQGLEANIAGKLSEFLNILIVAQSSLKKDQIGEEWVCTLTSLFNDIFELDVEEEITGKLIKDLLDSWLIQLMDAGFSDTISLSIMRDYLKEKLGVDCVSHNLLTGQVNFCNWIPMRSIPFNVVCLLGMNDGDYPRTTTPVGFDLMAGHARMGDPSRRDNDRYLFLEALQSAQQCLYISYVGRSVLDNSPKVASVLITELLDYCRQGYCINGDKRLPEAESGENLFIHLVHHNPLVPFSYNAFNGERASYANEWLPAAKREGQHAEPFCNHEGLNVDIDLSINAVKLTELQHFWRLPVQYFFNHRLKVFFDEPEGVMEDVEPFTLDNLHRYQLRDALLVHVIANGSNSDSLAAFYQRQQASGTLPLNFFGKIALESEQETTLTQFNTLKPFLTDHHQALEVNISIPTSRGTVKLQGWLDERYRAGRVLYRSGKVREIDKLATWIDHLCQCASGEQIETYFFGVDDAVIFTPMCTDEAISHLKFYLESYFNGTESPYPYLPITAMAGLQACINKEGQWQNDDATKKKAKSKMRCAYEGGHLTKGEGENIYIARVWPEASETLLNKIFSIGTQVLLPLLHGEKKKN